MLTYRNKKVIVFTLIASVMLLLTFVSNKIGFSCDSSFMSHIVFHFFHANILHLVGNLLVLWFILTNAFCSYTEEIIVAYIASTIASFFSCMELPTIGYSGDLCAMIGIVMPMVATRKNVITIALSLAMGFFVPSINAMIHLLSFIIGLCYSLVRFGYLYDLIINIYEKFSKKSDGLF